jgi:hypothetical protein
VPFCPPFLVFREGELLTLVAPDTYTPEELMRCSRWCLAGVSGLRGIHLGARDRAMLLFSTSTAFRGESARILQWSDLFVSEIPMNDVSPGFRVPASIWPMLRPSSESSSLVLMVYSF